MLSSEAESLVTKLSTQIAKRRSDAKLTNNPVLLQEAYQLVKDTRKLEESISNLDDAFLAVLQVECWCDLPFSDTIETNKETLNNFELICHAVDLYKQFGHHLGDENFIRTSIVLQACKLLMARLGLATAEYQSTLDAAILDIKYQLSVIKLRTTNIDFLQRISEIDSICDQVSPVAKRLWQMQPPSIMSIFIANSESQVVSTVTLQVIDNDTGSESSSFSPRVIR